jgi:pSer/pThr/pTyr-binding forkhead associated (FHA) protein
VLAPGSLAGGIVAVSFSPFVIAVLKYAFLALLYFFVFRAIRAVALEIAARPAARRSAGVESRPARPASRQRGKAKVPTVLVVRGEDGRKIGSHQLRETLQVGRADACHVRLEDRYASQFHARLYPRNGSWYVEDLGSTNGTYLNRQRLNGSAEVHAGDVVRIGKTTLELRR